MTRLRISPSMLENYRLARHGIWPNAQVHLEEQLRRIFKPTPAISRGKAFHTLLEEGTRDYLKEIEVTKKKRGEYQVCAVVYERESNTTWTFGPAVVDQVNKYRDAHPDLQHEIWNDLTTQVKGYEVLMRMRLDGMEGLVIREAKTTASQKKYVDFRGSMQWRAELFSIPDAEAVVYDVFQLNKDNTRIRYTEFRYDRDQEFEQEFLTELEYFVGWLEQSGYVENVIEENWMAGRY